MPMPFAFSHRVEVRFRDCDPMGHVNHAVYLSYLEQARFAFWRNVTGRSPGQAAGIILARVECDYRAPAFFGEWLEVRINVAAIGASSFTLTYEIVNTESGRLLAEARTVLVAFDYATNRSIPVSPEMRAHLESSRVQ